MNQFTYTRFPVSQLPEVLRTFVESGAKALGCDPASLALPALCVAAGILGGSRRLQMKSSWNAPPMLWGCVLGESGTIKSPAMRLALAPLRQRARQEHERYQAALDSEKERQPQTQSVSERKIRRTQKALAKVASPRRVLVADTTTEALAMIARDNPLGLLLGRDELASLFGGFDRYATKTGGDEAFFLSAFDGESVTVDCITEREHVFVPSMSLSIIGTCQPAVFAKLMTSQRRESGMTARFLVVQPPMKAKRWTDNDFDGRVDSPWAKVIDRLLELELAADAEGAMSASIVGRTEEAHALYRDFFNAHNEEACDETGDWRAFLAKAEQIPLRLALILHYVRWAQSEDLEEGFNIAMVDAATMASAIELTKWFIQEAKRVYALLGATPEEWMAFEPRDWIREKGGKATVREIMRNAPRKFRESELHVNRLLDVLSKHKRGSSPITILPALIDDRPLPDGRPPSREFRLNAA